MGCGGDRTRTPYLGKWHGGVEAVRLRGSDGDARPYSVRGDLQLYVRKFEMNLAGPQQGVVVKGAWAVTKNARGEARVSLKANDVKIDDRGGEEKRDPNKPYLRAEDLNAYFGRDLVLRPSPDGSPTKLTGIDDELGPFVVRPAFERD